MEMNLDKIIVIFLLLLGIATIGDYMVPGTVILFFSLAFFVAGRILPERKK